MIISFVANCHVMHVKQCNYHIFMSKVSKIKLWDLTLLYNKPTSFQFITLILNFIVNLNIFHKCIYLHSHDNAMDGMGVTSHITCSCSPINCIWLNFTLIYVQHILSLPPFSISVHRTTLSRLVIVFLYDWLKNATSTICHVKAVSY